MRAFSITAALAAALAASTVPAAQAEPVFNRIASFAVAGNLPAGADWNAPTSAEIIAATEDGNTLIYTDSPGKRIGFIDITDARAPKAGGIVAFDGEPTSSPSPGRRRSSPSTRAKASPIPPACLPSSILRPGRST